MHNYMDQLTAMRMNRQNGHISPHKAIMMLAVIDLIASGETNGNQIVYGPELLEHFRRYFDVVKTDADSCTPLNPFWHLRTEPFWHHAVHESKNPVYDVMDRPRGANVMLQWWMPLFSMTSCLPPCNSHLCDSKSGGL